MKESVLRTLLWMSSSLWASAVTFAFALGVPFIVYFSLRLVESDLFTPLNFCMLAFACLVAGAICGGLVWWTIFKPFQERIEKFKAMKSEDKAKLLARK